MVIATGDAWCDWNRRANIFKKNNVQTDNAIIKLRKLISDAFPASTSLSHADCKDLRTKLVSLRDEDVLTVLGPVLLDLIETHTKSLAVPDWADSVVRFLSAAEPSPVDTIPGRSFNTKQFSDFSAFQPEAEALFKKFTIEQSRAVYSWLQAARLWNESQLSSRELESALAYWNRKSKSGTHSS